MADARDVLGLARPAAALPFEAEAAPKAKAPKMKRPEGLSREAFALHDGSHPVAPTHLPDGLKKASDIQGLKQKRLQTSRGKVTWQWQKFANEARSDGLQLEHWAKCWKDAAGNLRPDYEGPYRWAKLDVKPLVYRYNDEEWDNVLARDADWSRAETDYLLDLCDTFRLRFVLIADRYEFPNGKPRSVEALKARYYSVARQLLTAREGGEAAVTNHVLIKQPYNPEQERQRRQAVGQLLQRKAGAEAEEQAVLQRASVIEARRRQEAASQRAAAVSAAAATPLTTAPSGAASLAETPATGSTVDTRGGEGGPTLLNARGQAFAPRPGVYARSRHAAEQGAAQITSLPGGQRVHKATEAAMQELGVPERPPAGTRAVCAAWLALRAEVIERLEMTKASRPSDPSSSKKSKSKGSRR